MSWERQANGPDWLDLQVFAETVEQHHKCVVYVMLLPDGRHGVGCWRVLVTLTPEPIVAGSGREPIGTDAVWPTASHKTIQGLIYHLLMRADYDATRDWWKQGVMLA